MLSLPPPLRLVIGLVGSLAITAGSLGVGWLAPGSSLQTQPFIALLRNSHAAAWVCTLLVVAGVLLLLAAWLSLGLSLRASPRLSPSLSPRLSPRGRTDAAGTRAPDAAAARRASTRAPLRQVATSAIVWSAPLLFALPLFSRDIYAYLGQGRMLVAGLDPYTDVMADVPGWFEAGVDIKWSTTVTPYGPLFVLLARIVVVATSWLPIEASLFGMRLLAVAGLAMLAYYGWRIARLRGFNEAAVLWAIAASPLVLMNFVVAGHNDALMLGLIVAGAYWALRQRPVLATLLVTAAIGIKPIALIALPIIGIIWAGSTANWGALIRRWAAVAAIAAGSIVALGVGLGVGVGWIAGLGTPIEIGSWYSIPRILSLWSRDLADGLGGDGDQVRSIVVLAFLAIGCAIAAFLVTVKRRADPLWLLAGVFAALALFSPLLHPWYGLWLLSLCAVAGLRRLWQARLFVYATVFFVLIGISGEQVDLIDRLRADPAIPTVYGLTGLVGAVVLVALFEWTLHRRFTGRGLAAPMLALPAAERVNASSTPSP
ncbi:polyprenol phosphomannose-dependent alpha 1,6 mannosyltransferase MptB [Herbiconiux daphne]|uniref:Polyprenol phosphomannose-dependent alpha 1,6 mannosyltransferase MptB n=1 Tax=Herbiconiux daphne TaxID=2970914 RepID=A0ABT2H6C4_9MICO|nr:polyprenol phosphomannose-dependent alpha 1,6 mannosyltransferase MptB [Herbiconiux daphne]MCS5735476.1 polyprenol phosphomannose-dependent alpha 1,6 mannosyltransferase MptB [Herbiconiux daphne]